MRFKAVRDNMIRLLRRNNKEPSSDDEVEGGGCFIDLPSEIIVDILCRLPVESVLRCKSVCKLWHSLISSNKHHPYFFYLNHRLIFANSESRCIRVCHVSDVLHDKSIAGKALEFDKASELLFSFKSSNPSSSAYISASCNGLICFLDDKNPYDLFIWNPSSRICGRPISPDFPIKYYGFGYDKSSDDYKFFARSESWRKPEIYSLKTGKWKKIGDFYFGYYVKNVDGKYYDGALHWADSSLWTIISLDLATETYSQVSLPDQYGHASGYTGLILGALLDEGLCALCYCFAQRYSDIWVMKDKNCWTKLVSIPEYMRGGLINLRCMTPLFISNDGKILFKLDYQLRRLILCDSKTGSCSEIQTDFDVDGKTCIVVESGIVSPHRAVAWIQIKDSITAICKYYFGINLSFHDRKMTD